MYILLLDQIDWTLSQIVYYHFYFVKITGVKEYLSSLLLQVYTGAKAELKETLIYFACMIRNPPVVNLLLET